jgi:type II secretion system protein G
MISQKNHRPVSAFTLIEILIVIAIIAILASLVLAAASGVQKKGARSRAEGEIAALGAALESFKADNGDYPSNSVTNSSACLVTNLMPTNGGKVYFEFKTKWIDANKNFLDPFGYSYNYIYTTNGSATNGSNNYDLWSTAGQITDTNSAHWIKNW